MNHRETDVVLSILIPVYNYDCRILVERLNEQLMNLPCKGEIILGNDASAPRYRSIFEDMASRGLCTLHTANQNIGVGAMRNRLTAFANGNFLLYLDSDTVPLDECFLKRYLEFARPETVIVGGFTYPQTPPVHERLLRYRYGHEVEMQSADNRNKRPYDKFIAMSFLIPADTKKKVPFDEQGMGYEDALFGYTLQENGIEVLHIDNPVLHDLKETSEEFLATTRRYVTNLLRLRQQLKGKRVRLANTYQRVKLLGLRPLLAKIYQNPRCRSIIEKQLCSENPQLKLFSLYKLAYLCHIAKKKQHNIIN